MLPKYNAGLDGEDDAKLEAIIAEMERLAARGFIAVTLARRLRHGRAWPSHPA
jgi:hypothetical protein